MRLTFLLLSTAIIPAVFACGGTTEPAGEATRDGTIYRVVLAW